MRTKVTPRAIFDFELHGEKLADTGIACVCTASPVRSARIGLLIKGDDESARPGAVTIFLRSGRKSVKTGREVAEVAGEALGWSLKTGRINEATKARTRSGALSRPLLGRHRLLS